MQITATRANTEVLTYGTTGGTTQAAPTEHPMPKDRAKMSGPGALIGKLQELQETDPAAFRDQANAMAEKLRAGAEGLEGKEADMVNELADKLSEAAESGDLSALEPSGPPPGPRPREGAAAYKGQAAGHHGPSEALKSLMDEVLGSLGGASQ